MECRCYHAGCSTAEQVCRPRLKRGQPCSLPSGPDDMVTRSCEIGTLCNAAMKTPRCQTMYSIANGHLASEDRLCHSQYRDSLGNCTTWPSPRLIKPTSDCNIDDDCETSPPGHGKCACSTNPTNNHGVCKLATDPPDDELAIHLGVNHHTTTSWNTYA
jgi:hypothetical protein